MFLSNLFIFDNNKNNCTQTHCLALTSRQASANATFTDVVSCTNTTPSLYFACFQV